MKALFWTSPWAAHGDPLFYRNALRKHLIPQANLLKSAGFDVELILPALLGSERSGIASGIRVIDLPFDAPLQLYGTRDPSEELYLGQSPELTRRLAKNLEKFLSLEYDVILLWETPVPFMEELFPNALIVHQMPGFFSRPPFPHTVTFDPSGLYKNGTLYRCAGDILNTAPTPRKLEVTREFVSSVRRSVNAIQPFDSGTLDPKGEYSRLLLLPLQVSAHYAFQADTNYETQTDFLLDVLSQEPEDTGVVVTQYVTPRVQDAVLNRDVAAALFQIKPNLIYREEFDKVSSVSQYLLPFVDSVRTCSSSVGVQAMAWGRELEVDQATFLAPFATREVTSKGMSWDHACDSTLSFILNTYQPLASAVVEDKAFLVSLLEEMVARKRAGRSGLDLLPDFSSIDPDYPQRLLDGFRVERAARDISRTSHAWSAQQREIEKFRKALASPSLKAITFDIFDTLIKRPVETPADIYKFLETIALDLTSGIAEDFARVRVTAELDARNAREDNEITLDDIYENIQQYYKLDRSVLEAVKHAEIKLELQVVSARPFGRKLWGLAVSSGRPIYLISDMYLPEVVIRSMLDKTGFKGYRKLYLSSSYGKCKKRGELFDIVLGELGIEPNAILHIGDNKIADIEQPQARGINAFRTPRAIDRLRGNEIYRNIYPPKSGAGERARTALAGLTAHALFDCPSGEHEKTTHFQGSPWNLGYAGLGPMLTGYMLWLGRQAKRDGVSHLYFLSREGWLLRQVYCALHGENALPCTYLYASRRATRVASLTGKGDVLALAAQPFKPGVSLSELLRNRFGIEASDIPVAALHQAGFSSIDEPLSPDAIGRVRFSNLCGSVTDLILQEAQAEREAYLSYLKTVGLDSQSRAAVVDIGWRANIQGALGQLLGRPLHGYYYATLQGTEKWRSKGHTIWGYAGDMLANEHPSAAIKHRPLLEYLTCHIEPSLLKLERKGDVSVPIFRAEEGLSTRRIFIEQVHEGAIRFARDFRDGFEQCYDELWIDSFLGERVFASFANAPSSVDALMLAGHSFEDALAGVSRKFLVTPTSRNAHKESVWKQGAVAAYKLAETSGPAELPTIKHAYQKDAEVKKDRKRLIHRLESLVIKLLVNEKKQGKYQRSREEFLRDARSPLAQAWLRWTS